MKCGGFSSQPMDWLHNCCKRILILTITGDRKPNTSHILAAKERIDLFVQVTSMLSCILNEKLSSFAFHCIPKILETLFVSHSRFLQSLSSSGMCCKRDNELEDHFTSSKPPDLKKLLSSR
uniref:Uncharacterized protein n=1 Tax=Cacopsylla melanoneura TaxID=428564 RepID=A0A8D8QI35_9HEMI